MNELSIPDVSTRALTALENLDRWERRYGPVGINLRPIITDLAAEVERLKTQEQRLRQLHSPRRDYTDEYVCTGCGDYYGDCRTIAALDGDD